MNCWYVLNKLCVTFITFWDSVEFKVSPGLSLMFYLTNFFGALGIYILKLQSACF